MEKQLKFVLNYSLEEITLRRVVANLWTETDIVVMIQNFPCECPHDIEHRKKNRNVAFNKVKAKLSKLVIPASLKERMMDLIKPIGTELMQWKTFHDSIFQSTNRDLSLYMLKRVVWTSAGTIDYRRTAKILLCSDVLGVRTRYSIACLYCYVDDIPVLWNELPEVVKNCYLSAFYVPLVRELQLEFYWAHVMVGEEPKLERIVTEPLREVATFNQHAFETFARKGNRSATDYFLRKLSTEVRNASLMNAVNIVISDRCTNTSTWKTDFPLEKLSEMLCYLLSLMSPAQQEQIIRKRPVEVLRCFLDWPCQDLFLETADFVFTFLPETKYGTLLRSITKNIESSGYYFPMLFRKFFINSPREFKSIFINYECQFCSYFDEFFNAEDAETIKCFFRNVTVEDRMSLCSRYNFFRILDPLIMNGKWYLVKMCIEEISPFQKDRARLEETYMGYLRGVDSRNRRLRKRRWRQIFQECDEEDKATASSKRSSRGKTLIKAKKLQTQ
ncbi:uncharacterized protein LOC129956966 [Argiope bruennichi]|uniref:Uncharacterized protein n=1 Tax=Argiope bruennichi TaxID=94029 RepID=A0A8T0FES0_ARGBR|nr:uncharacterized protein LOC129956966 [Argiope bruennichi]KAF8789461.1 hypothetical protein HNY73_007398 [Argiope bruennichi]